MMWQAAFLVNYQDIHFLPVPPCPAASISLHKKGWKYFLGLYFASSFLITLHFTLTNAPLVACSGDSNYPVQDYYLSVTVLRLSKVNNLTVTAFSES